CGIYENTNFRDIAVFLFRYGFITFETQEDAQKILQEAKKLSYKDKKLNIGPAVRKQQIRIPRSTVIPESGTMYLTTSSGYPYIYHNGVAYFHTPEVASVPQPWPVSNRFLYTCFSMDKDECSISNSLLLLVSPAMPYV
uniref:Protein boule-like n=1 Tax=Anas platyrhynchos TaxID=8839 RepID=A0A8B9TAG5_ANAPL